jgi:tetratricopeptide (TPR) repeat protein
MAGLTDATALKRAKADIKQYSIDHEPARWAEAHLLLSHQCVFEAIKSSGPTRAADKGIEHIEEALKVITEQNHAPNFTTAHAGLTRLYLKRVAGNRSENLTKSLACAQSALRGFERLSFGRSLVADMYAAIGSIYADHDFESSVSRADNYDLAIRHYLASLQRSSMNDDNDNWADRQLEVGLVYYKRKNGKSHSNMKVAIKHLVEALKVFTKSKHPFSWANAHEHLALSCWRLIQIGHSANMSAKEFAEELNRLLEKSIVSWTNALQVFTPTYNPASW